MRIVICFTSFWRDPSIDNYEGQSLHVSISKLKAMNKPIQCFAIFVPNDVPFANRLAVAHAQINLFYQKGFKKISRSEINKNEIRFTELS